MNIKENIYIFLALAITGILFSFTPPSNTTKIDIEKLNGKWELPCHENFENPGQLECAEFIGYIVIKVDTETGEGIEKNMDGYGAGTKFKVFEANGKMMIDYFFPPSNEKISGEIVVLDDKELKVKFEEKGFYTIQQRAKK